LHKQTRTIFWVIIIRKLQQNKFHRILSNLIKMSRSQKEVNIFKKKKTSLFPEMDAPLPQQQK